MHYIGCSNTQTLPILCINKKELTETDIRTKFINPAIVGLGSTKWDVMTQILEALYLTRGRVIVRGKSVTRGEAKKAVHTRAVLHGHEVQQEPSVAEHPVDLTGAGFRGQWATSGKGCRTLESMKSRDFRVI